MVDKEQWCRFQLEYDSRSGVYSKYTNVVISKDHAIVKQLSEDFAVRASGPLTVLDVGCGPAEFYEKLNHLIACYIGVEPSAGELLRAPHDARIHLFRGGGERLHLGAECIDLALLISSLDHCLDARATIDEVLRVLRPGGRLIILLENRGRLSNIVRRVLGFPIGHGDEHTYYFDLPDVINLLGKRASIVHMQSVGFLLGFDTLDRFFGESALKRLSDAADTALGAIFPHRGQHFVIAADKAANGGPGTLTYECPACASPFEWGAASCERCGHRLEWIAPGVLNVLNEPV